MTREEVVERIKEIKDRAWGWHINGEVLGIDYDEFIEIMDSAIAILRPVSREQVEKVWRGEWIISPNKEINWDGEWYQCKCSKCGNTILTNSISKLPLFCMECYTAMMDEAVEMVVEKINNMEEMTNEH